MCAVIIFSSIFIGAGFYTRVLSKEVKQMEDHLFDVVSYLKQEDWENCNKKTKELLKEWHSTQKWLKAIINHKEIDLILETLYEMKGYIDVKNREEALVKAEVLKVLLEHIPENEALLFINIL